MLIFRIKDEDRDRVPSLEVQPSHDRIHVSVKALIAKMHLFHHNEVIENMLLLSIWTLRIESPHRSSLTEIET